MENASKALIIAGAILLSILIIGLGMAVYNNASSTVQDADLSSQEVLSFNSQFEGYSGKQKGTVVKNLIAAIKANNQKGGNTITCTYSQNSLVNNQTYTVNFEYDPNTGLITKLSIPELNGGADPTADPTAGG